MRSGSTAPPDKSDLPKRPQRRSNRKEPGVMGAPEVLSERYRAALIGGGFIGPVHAEALRRIGVEVAGLLDLTPDLARASAAKLGVTKVYDTLDDLVADPSVDVVHIASP